MRHLSVFVLLFSLVFISCSANPEKLIKAVSENDIVQIKAILENGKNNKALINTIPESGENTALHEAVAQNNLDILEYLISKGGNPSIKNGLGKTALHLAMDLQNYGAYQYLLKSANIDMVDAEGNSLIVYALMKDEKTIAKSLALKKPDLSLQNYAGVHALALITDYDKFDQEMLDFFINSKVPYSSKDAYPFSSTYLSRAMEENDADAIQRLMDVADKLRCTTVVKATIAKTLLDYYNTTYVGTSAYYSDERLGEEVLLAMVLNAYPVSEREPEGWTLLHWILFTQNNEDLIYTCATNLFSKYLPKNYWARPFVIGSGRPGETVINPYFTLLDMAQERNFPTLEYLFEKNEITDNKKTKDMVEFIPADYEEGYEDYGT